jgi:hypothetical protein
MTLIPELLHAIVRVDGEALMIHAGDKPYVVAATEHVDLANHGLTLEVVNGIVAQLLPVNLQHSLDEFGAVQHELSPRPEFPGESFTVVAARDGDDVRVEIRRRRIPDEDRVPDEFFTPVDPPPSEPASSLWRSVQPIVGSASTVGLDDDELPVEILGFDPSPAEKHSSRLVEAAVTPQSDEPAGANDDLALPDEADLFPGQAVSSMLPDFIAASALDEEDEIALFADERFVAVETEPEQPEQDIELPVAKSIWGAPPSEPAHLPAADAAQREQGGGSSQTPVGEGTSIDGAPLRRSP